MQTVRKVRERRFRHPDTCVSNLGSGQLFRQTWRMGDFVVGPEAADEDTGPVTIYDIQAPEDRKVRPGTSSIDPAGTANRVGSRAQ